MMRFDFTISHVPGNELTIANALSRAPVSTSSAVDQSFQSETTAYVNLVVESIPATEKRLQEIREHQEKDPVCQKLSKFCKSGWPEKITLSADLKPYFCISAQLSIANGLLLRGKRIIVPPPLRKTLPNDNDLSLSLQLPCHSYLGRKLQLIYSSGNRMRIFSSSTTFLIYRDRSTQSSDYNGSRHSPQKHLCSPWHHRNPHL